MKKAQTIIEAAHMQHPDATLIGYVFAMENPGPSERTPPNHFAGWKTFLLGGDS